MGKPTKSKFIITEDEVKLFNALGQSGYRISYERRYGMLPSPKTISRLAAESRRLARGPIRRLFANITGIFS